MASELTALEKHGCPACGASAEWDPGRQALVCPFCGTRAPAVLDQETGEIQELDLVQALRNLPDEKRGWQADRKAVRCRSCDAVSVFEAERVAQNCTFCGSPSLVDYEELKAPIRPQSLIPFRQDREAVGNKIRGWLRSRWFAPGALKSRALVDTINGVYLPYWTFDAHVDCRWSADAGHYYYTTEVVRDSHGNRRSRRVQNIRWERVSGQIDHFFDDEPVAGCRGVRVDLLKRIEPFPGEHLVPYDTVYLAGFVVEHYQVVLIEAARRGREAMRSKLRSICASLVPGDTHRNLQIFPVFMDETFKHILVPVWLLSYDYGPRAFQVLVNGVTGEVAGDYPKSWIKIALLVLAVAVAGILVGLFSQL